MTNIFKPFTKQTGSKGVLYILFTLIIISLDASAITYNYSKSGRLISAVYSKGSMSYSYDKAGNIIDSATSVLNPVSLISSAGDNGSITPLGELKIAEGSEQTFTITSDPGYQIKDVLVDGISVGPQSSYTFSNVTESHSIEAVFAAETYLTLAILPEGAGSTNPVSGKMLLNIGQSQKLTATPKEGFRFIRWSGSAGSVITNPSSSATSVSISADATITAVFSQSSSSNLMLSYPNGNDILQQGSTKSITWLSDGKLSNIKIELIKPDSSLETIAESLSDTGFYDWNIPDTLPVNDYYKIKISGNSTDSLFSDESDSYFAIVGSKYINLTAPNGDERWLVGQTYNITWNSNEVIGKVKLELYKNQVFDSTIIVSTENDGIYEWTIPENLLSGGDYRVKVISLTNALIRDRSNAEFSIISTQTSSLTMAAYPTGSGSTNPAVGEISVNTGEWTVIEAKAATGYKFARWATDHNVKLASKNNAITYAYLSGDAKVTAMFKLYSESSDFGKVTIKYDSSKENSDKVSIVKAQIPASITEQDLDASGFDISLMIDDYKIDLSAETGVLKQQGKSKKFVYKPNKDQVNAKLIIDLSEDKNKVKSWTCKLSKINLGSKIDNSDGVDILLSINNKLFGNNLVMNEKSKWKFSKTNADLDSIKLDVTGAPMSEFSISKAMGQYGTRPKGKDSLNITNASLDSLSFDSAKDPVSLQVDEIVLNFNEQSAWSMKSESKAIYKAKSDNATIMLQMDFSQKSWSCRISKATFANNMSPENGIDIKLRVGNHEGGLRLNTINQITELKYSPEK